MIKEGKVGMARRTDPDAGEVRRNQILDAATAVFARLGFERARMDDIVEASGLSKGALYWYFNSKEEIITASYTGYLRPTSNNYKGCWSQMEQ